ncbi:MAG: CopG family transcriptional regulator [Acidimicrobiia bacterium]
MIRKQVYIDDDLERALKRLARRTGRPEAEHVRAALRNYVAEQGAQPGRDPMLAMAGLVTDGTGPTDVAHQHDHYLYGAPKRDR